MKIDRFAVALAAIVLAPACSTLGASNAVTDEALPLAHGNRHRIARQPVHDQRQGQ